MKANVLRELTIDELTTKENDFKQELFNLRFQAVTGKLENTARLRQVRKDIAKIKTVIREKQFATDGGNA